MLNLLEYCMDQKSDRTHRNFPSKNSCGNFVFVLEFFPFSHGTAPTLQKKNLFSLKLFGNINFFREKRDFPDYLAIWGKRDHVQWYIQQEIPITICSFIKVQIQVTTLNGFKYSKYLVSITVTTFK